MNFTACKLYFNKSNFFLKTEQQQQQNSKRQWRNISNIVKERKNDPRILHQARLPFKDEEYKLLVTYKNPENIVLMSTS